MSTEMILKEEEFLAQESSLKEKLQLVLDSANAIEVVNEPSFKKMTSLYSDSKEWEKRIEFLRKQANQPDQERINTRNDKAKEILNPLKQIQSIAKKKCEQYQLILEQQKIEEEKKAEVAADLLGSDQIPVIAPLEKSIRGDGALMFTRTVRKFRIVDLSKVPLKYLQVNEDVVKQDISLGIAEIPGLEIFEEKVVQLKTR